MLLSFLAPNVSAASPSSIDKSTGTSSPNWSCLCGCPTGPTQHVTSSISPNCGGGGGGGGGGTACALSPASNEIEGCVFDYRNSAQVVSGITVYLITGLNVQYETFTDSNGHFAFIGSNPCGAGPPCILPYTSYSMSINGVPAILYPPSPDQVGLGTDNMQWGQWAATVSTNGNSYEGGNIYLDEASPTYTVYAELFSHTQWTTEAQYTIGQTNGFSHALSLSVDSSVGSIGIGYQATQQEATGNGYGEVGNHQYGIGWPSWGETYYCNGGGTDLNGYSCGSPGIVRAGVTQIPNAGFQYTTVTEYLNPQGVKSPDPMLSGTTFSGYYSESNSITWTLNGGPSITFPGYGVTIKLDASVSITQGQTDGITFNIANNSSYSLTFLVYTAGQAYDPTSHTGGLEIHIWCVSQTGCS